jgi:putative restriction endonuclease
MRFWWVNHKQTRKQEIEGEYLWSPKEESNGNRSQFYDNMKIASRNDFVISYASRQIRNIGRVVDDAISYPKPDEFGSIGGYWSDEGWRLPVSWIELEKPIQPIDTFDKIKGLFPKKYSPLNEKGDGNQKAYLSEISEPLFEAIVPAAYRARLENIEIPLPNYESVGSDLEENVEQGIKINLSLSDTEKHQLLLARRGQGTFRKNVYSIERYCRVTGIETIELLVASHIIPWSLCSSANERLDGNNGLLLTPSIDRLFDRGYITFLDDGSVKISSHLKDEDAKKFGLLNISTIIPLNDKQKEYMSYHRDNIFKG